MSPVGDSFRVRCRMFPSLVLQNYARKYSYPIDQLKFHYRLDPIVKEEQLESDPEIEQKIVASKDGVLVHGLFLDAARWDMKEVLLADSKPGEMIPMLPIIHFLPSMNPQPKKGVYNCTFYKTSIRAGVLSTTGHSTNFITSIQLPKQAWGGLLDIERNCTLESVNRLIGVYCKNCNLSYDYENPSSYFFH